MNIHQFIQARGLTMKAISVRGNPLMTDMPTGSKHFRCAISGRDYKISVPFSVGPGIVENWNRQRTLIGKPVYRPELADVLDCLASEATGLENSKDFNDWCSEYGYDSDSRKAERIYNAVQEQTEELSRLLDAEGAYNALLYHVDRL